MKKYIGTKQVSAEPMNLDEFIEQTGRNPYANSSDMHGNNEEGYIVEYEDGYKSWSPKAVFEKAYKCAESFLDRLIIEQEELSEKLSKLRQFIESPKFLEIVKDEYQRRLHCKQESLISEYLDIINERIKLLQK